MFFRENIRAVVGQLYRGCIKALGVQMITIFLVIYFLQYL